MRVMDKETSNNLFTYDDGKLLWKAKKGKMIAGSEAGTMNDQGYMIVMLDGQRYRTHKIIFLMHHGYMPKYVDHIDGNRSNNKIKNLRECTQSENMYNASIRSDNRSGEKGVSWHKGANKWRVRLYIGGQETQIGLFDDFELAQLVSAEARDKFHKEFARTK